MEENWAVSSGSVDREAARRSFFQLSCTRASLHGIQQAFDARLNCKMKVNVTVKQSKDSRSFLYQSQFADWKLDCRLDWSSTAILPSILWSVSAVRRTQALCFQQNKSGLACAFFALPFQLMRRSSKTNSAVPITISHDEQICAWKAYCLYYRLLWLPVWPQEMATAVWVIAIGQSTSVIVELGIFSFKYVIFKTPKRFKLDQTPTRWSYAAALPHSRCEKA